jgi:hypothetical protein
MTTTKTSSVDISVFKAPTQTSNKDRVALETIRTFISAKVPSYNYLELGSYLGGTLLPHLVSPNCNRILSVDRRVSFQPDERRAAGYSYEGITTSDLKNELRRHVEDSECFSKLETYDGMIDELDPQIIQKKYPAGFHLCFIDAEHTNEAVFSDFMYTYQLAASDSVIMLHDSWMLGSGIKNIICYLQFIKAPFYFRQIKDTVTAFFLGSYANQDHLPMTICSVPFDQEGYFKEINNSLWSYREETISGRTLVKQLTKKVMRKLHL